LGLVLMVAMLITTGTPILILVIAMALPKIFRKDVAGRAPLAAPARQIWAVRYFGLCGFLALFIYFAGRLLHR
jgi:hypothetical protein